MNRNTNTMLVLDLKVRFHISRPPISAFKALKWLLPLAISVAKFLITLHHAGP